MVKRDTAVVFKPIGDLNSIKQEIEKIDNSELLNYKDVGAEYQGYSKVKQGNNTYKLLKQSFYNFNGKFGWAASNGSNSLTINNRWESSTFYITNMVITAISDVACFFKVYDNQGKELYYHYCPQGYNQISVEFKPALPFTSQTILFRPYTMAIPSVPVIITGTLFLNCFGYLEDKS